MNKKILIYIGSAILLGLGGVVYYRQTHKQKPSQFFTVTKPVHRSITQEVRATGYLEVEDMMKIGSLVIGRIIKLYVEENEAVKKGQLLVEIDDGIGDTQVRETKALLDIARADFAYATPHFERQKALFEKGYIAKDAYEKATADFERAKNAIDQTRAAYDRAVIIYNNKKIKAPDDGVVIEKVSSEGAMVSWYAAETSIYKIAKDMAKMKAKLEIDETVVGDLRVGMPVHMVYDAYPNKFFEGTISDISNASQEKGGAISYLATVPVDNSQKLFRPTMSINASIIIAEKNDVIAVPINIFKINPLTLERIAKQFGYGYQPLSDQARQELKRKENRRALWVFVNNAFVEREVEIGINDHAYYEIVSGLSDADNLVVDTIEGNAMQEMFEKMFGKGL